MAAAATFLAGSHLQVHSGCWKSRCSVRSLPGWLLLAHTRSPRPACTLLTQLWHDPWRLLVGCILLNMTSRKQVEGVIWRLFERWPDAAALAAADEAELRVLLLGLGMGHKRTLTLRRFSADYLHTRWGSVRELYGIGKYAADAHDMFCLGNLTVEPDDYALRQYHSWLLSRPEATLALSPAPPAQHP